MTRNLEGIVLKKRNWRENDLEIVFFSQERGKIRLIATGARKFKSKLSGHLEPFNKIKIMLADGKNFDKIGQAISYKNFFKEKKTEEWEKIWTAQEAAELLNKILPEKQEEKKIYQLFNDYLFLDNSLSYRNSLVLFKWQTIILSGFCPILDHCANCGENKNLKRTFFSVSKGGLLCEKCSLDNDFQTIDKRTVDVLQHLVSKKDQKTAWIKLSEKETDFLEKKFIQFYSYHILK